MYPLFHDRKDAGKKLAPELERFAADDPLVLALPRGGVPVAFEIARALGAELDVCIVRKLGMPGQEELAMGAVASGGVVVFNDDVLSAYDIPEPIVEAIVAREKRELMLREQRLRGGRPPIRVEGRTVILVDDGLATGSTMRAAVASLRRANAGRIVVAVPVASPDTCDALRAEADEVVCAFTPDPFWAVGLWYEDFRETTDDEARDLLLLAGAIRQEQSERATPSPPRRQEHAP